jgi:hypothetical protein
MPGSKIFLDTNIIIYAFDVSAGEKHEEARKIMAELWGAGRGDHRHPLEAQFNPPEGNSSSERFSRTLRPRPRDRKHLFLLHIYPKKSGSSPNDWISQEIKAVAVGFNPRKMVFLNPKDWVHAKVYSDGGGNLGAFRGPGGSERGPEGKGT